MNLNLYSVYDSVVEAYNKPFTANNDREAERMFMRAFQQEDAAINEDLVLYYIGTFNTATSEIHQDQPVVLMKSANAIAAMFLAKRRIESLRTTGMVQEDFDYEQE